MSRMILKRLRKIERLKGKKKEEQVEKLTKGCDEVVNRFFDKLKPLLASSRYAFLDIACWLVFDGRLKLGMKSHRKYYNWLNYNKDENVNKPKEAFDPENSADSEESDDEEYHEYNKALPQ